jgi:hypothetical protein
MFLTVAILTTVLFILVFFCKYILQSDTEYEVQFDDFVLHLLNYYVTGPVQQGGGESNGGNLFVYRSSQ